MKTEFNYSIYDENDECIFIPSVFTPNSDGKNDTWQIHGMELYSNPSVRVFNRWGQIVFESIEQEYISWDGTNNNESSKELEISTYYYVIEMNAEDKTNKGSVTIKRYNISFSNS